MTMRVAVKFFASVRETIGQGQELLDLADGTMTVGAVRALLVDRGGVWAEALGQARPLRMAFNHSMCGADTPIADGGEIAFFPPVTGG
jgi:molybdopterin synthase sulfur carrier subunit